VIPFPEIKLHGTVDPFLVEDVTMLPPSMKPTPV